MTYFRHAPCDDMIAPAMCVVGAVHDRDPAEFLDALAEARRAGGPEWPTALVAVLASMVDPSRTPRQLLGWLDDEPAAQKGHP